MKLRGLAAGFAVGYYLGAKAGRERYEELRELIERAGPAVTKARAAVELGLERIREGTQSSDRLDQVTPPSYN